MTREAEGGKISDGNSQPSKSLRQRHFLVCRRPQESRIIWTLDPRSAAEAERQREREKEREDRASGPKEERGRKRKREREREAIKVNALQEMPSQSERNSALHQHFTLTTLGLDVSLPEL